MLCDAALQLHNMQCMPAQTRMRAPARLQAMLQLLARVRLTPPAAAICTSPALSAPAARCVVTRLLEQAVSTATAGPRRPQLKLMRPAVTLRCAPVA